MQGEVSSEPLTVAHRAFEGLFVRALSVSGPALEAVRAAGFDPERPLRMYSARVWHQARLAAAQCLFPELPEASALYALGRAFVDGFAQTVVGRVLAAAAPLLGPERVLGRIPSYMRVARTDVRVSMETVSDHHWRATFEESFPAPHFVAGAFEGVLLLTHAQPRADVVWQEGDAFQVDIRW